MPVTVYSERFQIYEREKMQEGSAAASTPSNKSNAKKSKWDVIKKAIFTPIGTKEYPLNRRRRSRRNHQSKEGEMQRKEEKILEHQDHDKQVKIHEVGSWEQRDEEDVQRQSRVLWQREASDHPQAEEIFIPGTQEHSWNRHEAEVHQKQVWDRRSEAGKSYP